MSVAAVVLAAGRSERFGRDKLWIELGDRPVWRWSFDTFAAHPGVDGVGLVVAPERLAQAQEQARGALFVVAGGSDRQASARAGVRAVPEAFENVLVHDGARPFVSASVVDRVLAALRASDAAFPAVAVADTIKRVEGSQVETIDRAALVAAQTPQGARRDLLLRAHSMETSRGTDEMALLEAMGVRPSVVEGDAANAKLTSPDDWLLALARLGAPEVRTGFGYDVHAFSTDPGRALWLGCARFEGECGLEGHSDADAVAHAVVDAVLGAGGLGDIGQHFPNTDARWRDAASSHFLRAAAEATRQTGWRIVHIDVTVLAEAPRIGPRAREMSRAMGEALGIDPERVSVKATTHEGIGAIGRGEGIAAMAVATLHRHPGAT